MFNSKVDEHSLYQVRCVLLPEVAVEEVHMFFDSANRELTMHCFHDISQHVLPRGGIAEGVCTRDFLQKAQLFIDSKMFSQLALGS